MRRKPLVLDDAVEWYNKYIATEPFFNGPNDSTSAQELINLGPFALVIHYLLPGFEMGKVDD